MKKFSAIFISSLLLFLSSCNQNAVIEKNPSPEKQPETEIKTDIPAADAKDEENLDITIDNPIKTTDTDDNTVSYEEPKKPSLNSGFDRTKTGFGYSPNSENKQVSIGNKYEKLMNENNAFFIDRSNTKNIYLTMDEGYENGYTGMILDTLREKGVQCAFFVTMPYVQKNPELIRRMINEGHILGNHSVNHKSMPTLDDDEAIKEITELHDYVLLNFGYKMKYFRPPMGEYSENSLHIADSLGYRSVFWSFAYRDWETDNIRGKDYAVNSVNNGIHNGCVLLLHAVSKDNAEGLSEIIDSLREKGYIFSSLDNIK